MAYKTPEQKAAEILIPLGFIHQNDRLLPYSFFDKEDTEFRAKADFYHAGLDLYVEIKDNHLNGKTSKIKAMNAYNRVEAARLQKCASYFQIQNQWNHSAAKQAIVQVKIGSPQFAVVFTREPDDETLKRIKKQGIQAFGIKRFSGIIKLQLAASDIH